MMLFLLQVGDGQVLLMDAGCEYHGYVSDVTRTWPVNGRYTAEQRQVYETVLEVRRRCGWCTGALSCVCMCSAAVRFLFMVAGTAALACAALKHLVTGPQILMVISAGECSTLFIKSA
jgi:Xaa-Pro aminopeptidase